MATTFLFSNLGASLLAAALSINDTTLSVTAGTGIKFPSPTANQQFALTISDAATGQLREIVFVTAVSGDVFTIIRAQEGTAAQSWAVGDVIANLWTAGTAANMIQLSGINVAGGVAGLDNHGNVSPQSVISSSGPTARTLASRFGDVINLKDGYGTAPGALCDGSAGDLVTIQTIYDNLPNGAVVIVPDGSLWNGTITTPNPNKSITWLLEGTFTNQYNNFIGDGDCSVSYRNGGASTDKILLNTHDFQYQATYTLWNCDPNFHGPFEGNYQQYSALAAGATSGPTSSGNTSPFIASMNSYGLGPASAYDCCFAATTAIYGQNSNWGVVVDIIDFTGRPTQAFRQWNEWDIEGNGYDWLPSSPGYYSAEPNGRVFAFMSLERLAGGTYAPGSNVSAFSMVQGSPGKASVIAVTAADGIAYTWYCEQSGVRAMTSPTFPVPNVFTGSIDANGVLTVSSYLTGPGIAVGDVISGCGFYSTTPIIVTGIINETGNIGTYQTNHLKAVNSFGMFSCQPVIDGTAIWYFGNTYNNAVSNGIWVTGNQGAASIQTVFGSNAKITNAGLDFTKAVFTSNAAAIRLGHNQVIDFSGDGTQANQNQRILTYSTYAGSNTLVYIVAGTGNVFEAADSGRFSTLHNTPDDGSGNVITAGNTTINKNIINDDIQIASVVGALQIAAGVSKVFVESNATTSIIMPPNPGLTNTQSFDLEVIFTAAVTATFTLGSGTQGFAGAALPTSFVAGNCVTFRWLQSANTWLHIINV